jgi:L-ascorbate metabolism protein UlaG (beta-lactamase superfamily)
MKARIAAAVAAIVCLAALGANVQASPPEVSTIAAPDWLVDAPEQAVGPDELDVRWLGTAGFEIRSARAAILIDPYYSRLPILRLLGKIRPDLAAIEREIHPAQAVFVSHGHFDHLLDAPEVARKLGCPLYTSYQGEKLAEAEGLPAQLRKPIVDGSLVQVGDIGVEAVQSQHSDMITQRLAGGEMTDHPTFPMGFMDYKNGPTYGFLIRWRGRTIYHNGTAQIVEAGIRNRHADVVLMCVSGWTATPHLWERVGAALTPTVLVPMHDDDFFKPISEGFHENPLAKRQAAFEAIKQAMPRTAIVTVGLNRSFRLRGAEFSK